MKVLQIANFVSPQSGGLRTAIDALRDGYEKLGWQVHRLTPFPDAERDDEVSGIRSVQVPTMGSYRVILARRQVQRAITSLQPDVVELSDKSTMAWISHWCAKQGIPCCVISHERMDLTVQHAKVAKLPLKLLSKHWKQQLAQHSSRVVCASSFASEEFANTPAALRVIPLGVALEDIHPKENRLFEPSTVRIVICSRLSEEKKPQIAIEAVRKLSQRRLVKLVVMGDGPMRSHLEELSIGLDINFLGHVSSRQQVFDELSHADVVLNLGAVETFGLVTLEALATGTPVIVANTGASSELLDVQCGRAVDVSPAAVVQAVEELLNERNCSTFSACRARAEQFPWSRTVSSFADMYQELVAETCNVS
jgi:alpha-1,6-mannosyltransferase